MSSSLVIHHNVKTNVLFEHSTEHIKSITVFVYRQSMPVYWMRFALLFSITTQGRWKVGPEAPPVFFQPPHKTFEPPFQKFITTIHLTALQRWLTLWRHLLFVYFFSLIPSNQRTNFCNFVTKVNKIAKTVGFPGNFVYKALRALL